MTGHSFRTASVFDGMGADGRPLVDRRLLDQTEAAHVLAYLESAPVVIDSQRLGADQVDGGRGDQVPLTWQTDGEWLWPGSVSYYLRTYALPPDHDFLEHIRQRQYRVPTVDPATERAAHSAVSGGNGRPDEEDPMSPSSLTSADAPASSGQAPGDDSSAFDRLRSAAVDLGVPAGAYRIGASADGAWCLFRDGSRWTVFLADRGERRQSAAFSTSHQAIAYLVGQLYLSNRPAAGEAPRRPDPTVHDADGRVASSIDAPARDIDVSNRRPAAEPDTRVERLPTSDADQRGEPRPVPRTAPRPATAPAGAERPMPSGPPVRPRGDMASLAAGLAAARAARPPLSTDAGPRADTGAAEPGARPEAGASPDAAEPGPTGQPDVAGRSGVTGRPDLAGRSGLTGQPDVAGRSGLTGQPDVTGRSGLTGQPDVTGRTGPAGRPGVDGEPNLSGRSGLAGRPGVGGEPDLGGGSDLAGKPDVAGKPGPGGQARPGSGPEAGGGPGGEPAGAARFGLGSRPDRSGGSGESAGAGRPESGERTDSAERTDSTGRTDAGGRPADRPGAAGRPDSADGREPGTGQPTAGSPTAGQPTAAQRSAEQRAAEQSSVGQPAGQPAAAGPRGGGADQTSADRTSADQTSADQTGADQAGEARPDGHENGHEPHSGLARRGRAVPAGVGEPGRQPEARRPGAPGQPPHQASHQALQPQAPEAEDPGRPERRPQSAIAGYLAGPRLPGVHGEQADRPGPARTAMTGAGHGSLPAAFGPPGTGPAGDAGTAQAFGQPGTPGQAGGQGPGGTQGGPTGQPVGQQPGQKGKPPQWKVQPLPGEPPLTLYRDKRMVMLPPGTEVDRYGDADGNVTYAARTQYQHRSLPGDWSENPYHVYRLQRPIEALTGLAVPWFEQPGGGTVFVLPTSINDLLADGTLVEVGQT